MSFKFQFSHEVYKARTLVRKFTQQQVADAISVSLREYQKIEKGEVLPGTIIFLRLIFFFGLDIKDYEKYVFKPESADSF